MARVVAQKAGCPKIQSALPPFAFWSCGLLCLISLIVTSKTFHTWNAIDPGLIQMSSCCISYEHLQQKGEPKNQTGHDLALIKKIRMQVREGNGEDGRAVVW